jgi:hypothetical protein
MKTIAQAAAEYALKTGYYGDKETFIAGVKWAQRWIPVEEELPENSDNEQSLLVKQDNGRVTICYYYRNNMFWSPSFFKLSNVTHWRPTELN